MSSACVTASSSSDAVRPISNSRVISILVLAKASRGPSASRRARVWAAVFRSTSSTTWEESPISSARVASMRSPSMSSSVARPRPTMRGRRYAEPMSAPERPTRVNKNAKEAERARMRMSEASARTAPAPAATPLMAAITGTGHSRRRWVTIPVMRIGVGLPTSTPDTSPEILFAWAQQAEAGPFSSLGVIDRLAYHNLDPLLALTAAAGVTNRIGLATMILIAPLRNPALLAKQAATLDVLSGGRLTLGVAVGARADDYEVAGLPATGRGARLSDQLETMRDAWE